MAVQEKKMSVHRMVLAAAVANMPAFVYGMSFGWMSPMAPLLQSSETPSSEPLSDVVVSWMAGCLSLGASVATPMFSILADRLGRKPTLILMSVIFMVSWAIKLVSAEPAPLIAARALAGLATGGIYLVIPCYVREISEDSIRGALGSIMMFAVNLGVITIYGMGALLSYHATLWLCLTLSLLHVVVACFMPESPGYSLKRYRPEEAEKTIAWLRNLEVTDPIVQKEIAIMQKEEEDARAIPKLTIMTIVRSRYLFRAVRMAFFVITTETMSGCFAVIQYSALIFYRAGTDWRPEHLALFVGATQLLGSVMSIYLVERCGRKPLLATSTLVIAGCMASIAAWFLATGHGLTVPSWLPVLAVCLCIFSYGMGLASVPFVIVAEIFSFQVRASLTGSVISLSWLISTLTVTFFMPVANAFGDHAVFFIFAAITCIGAMYTICSVPETRNKPLAEIQTEIEEKKCFFSIK